MAEQKKRSGWAAIFSKFNANENLTTRTVKQLQVRYIHYHQYFKSIILIFLGPHLHYLYYYYQATWKNHKLALKKENAAIEERFNAGDVSELVQMRNWTDGKYTKESKLITSFRKYITLTQSIFIILSSYREQSLFVFLTVVFPEEINLNMLGACSTK